MSVVTLLAFSGAAQLAGDPAAWFDAVLPHDGLRIQGDSLHERIVSNLESVQAGVFGDVAVAFVRTRNEVTEGDTAHQLIAAVRAGAPAPLRAAVAIETTVTAGLIEVVTTDYLVTDVSAPPGTQPNGGLPCIVVTRPS